jgi:glyoxylase-like metal-dependent hydrolase (beta-lactamase superfamily II)
MDMIKEIRSDLFCIEVPLPKSPLKSVNSYVIKGKDRNLVIDTAMNRPECKEVLLPGLEKLGIDLEKTDLFITHLHADHFGLTGDVASDKSKCYFGHEETKIIHGRPDWEEVLNFYVENGFPESVVRDSMSRHPGLLYSPSRLVDLTPVSDGEILRVGDYELRCIDTPGHSPGHVCLYDEKKKIFFSGDHILFDITPNITHWVQREDSLRDYLASLDKVSTLEVEMVLPGHRNPWHNHADRIQELKQHHRHRLDEVIAALQDGDMTAYEVAPYITWKIEARDWDDFPIAQKWFAVGETLAHLHYLEHDGVLEQYKEDGLIYYALS